MFTRCRKKSKSLFKKLGKYQKHKNNYADAKAEKISEISI